MQVFVVMERSCYGDELVEVFLNEDSAQKFCDAENEKMPDHKMIWFSYEEKELQE